MLQKEHLKGYKSYVNHYFKFSHLMSHIRQLTYQLAVYKFKIEIPYPILEIKDKIKLNSEFK